MRVLADEGVHQGLVAALRKAGHAVTYVAEVMPGAPDREVLKRATELEAILITTDEDFCELVFRQKLTHSGVILLRVYGCTLSEQIDIVLELFGPYADKVEDGFTVLDRNGFRFRHDPY